MVIASWRRLETYWGLTQMIKRNYFVKTEIPREGYTTHSWRQFQFTSWLPRPAYALTARLESIAEDNNCSVKELVVTAFNRC